MSEHKLKPTPKGISVGGTNTSEGFIPYARSPSGIDCPCKIVVVNGKPVMAGHDHLPVPLRDESGDIVYALPGGASWIP